MAKAKLKKINLALQGGGAHGAFAWGVLDALAEHGGLDVDGISATSAGAMNASVFAYGKMMGGNEGARTALNDFWYDVSQAGQVFAPAGPSWWDMFTGGSFGAMESAASYMAFDSFTRMISPYDFNPLNLNPLREILEKHVNFDELTTCECAQLFVCATNVRTNKIKIFDNEGVTADAVMASACLPMLFQAVEIDGEAYWDGGYMGNPALYPLVYDTATDDILIVHLNPIERPEIPKTAAEIHNRINEISFNSSLLRELRAFEFAKRLVEDKWIKEEFREHFKFDKLCMHQIHADKELRDLSVASKFNPDWSFLTDLRDRGRKEAKRWLKKHYDDVGKRSSMDLREEFE